MNDAIKRKAIIFLILTALITVLLAVALPQLKLQQGVPMPGVNRQTDAAGQEAAGSQLVININTFVETVLGLFFLMVLIYLLVRRQRFNRKDIIKTLIAFAMLALSLALLLFSYSNLKITIGPPVEEILPPELPPPVTGPPLTPAPMPLIWLIWIILGGLVLLFVMLVARVQIRHKTQQQDALTTEAEKAAEAIKAGQDFSNVIIRCYEQMSAVLKKERGLALRETMTAREFEALLEERGIPKPPVRQLTQLFEIARYAAQTPGPAEEAQAIDCLDTIARYSRKKEPGRRI